MDVRPEVQRKFLLMSMLSGPVAIIVAVLALAYVVLNKPPTPTDVHRELTAYTNASYFARNYLLVWLGGSTRQQDNIMAMTSAAGSFKLNPDPQRVTDLNITDVLWTPAEDSAQTEWAFTIAATTTPPGSNSTRNFYRVTLVESNGAFQAITLPRLVNQGTTPIRIATVYTSSTALDGVLGKTIANFAKAYLIPGDSGSLGRYVSEKFTESPISGSPYTAVRVTSINVGEGSPDPAQASAGDSVEIMVTVQASISLTTFTTMQLPLRVSLTSGGQWLVDSITEPVNFGVVEPR